MYTLRALFIYLFGFVLLGLLYYFTQKILNKVPKSVYKKYTTVGEGQKKYILITLSFNVALILFGLYYQNNPYILVLLALTLLSLASVLQKKYQIAMISVALNWIASLIIVFIFFSLANSFFFIVNMLILLTAWVLIDSLKFDESILNKPWEEAEVEVKKRFAQTPFYDGFTQSQPKVK